MWRNIPSPLAQTPGFGSVILDHFLFKIDLFLGEVLLNATPELVFATLDPNPFKVPDNS
jgi:hypothetical protein